MIAPADGDRRRHLRVHSRLLVRLRSQGAGEDTALARDIATGGLGIEVRYARHEECSGPMIWNGRVEVELDLPSGHIVRIGAEMVWWRLNVVGGVIRYRGGLRFVEMECGDKMRLENSVKVRAHQQSLRHSPRQAWSSHGPRPQG
jgi:hypothetical protein